MTEREDEGEENYANGIGTRRARAQGDCDNDLVELIMCSIPSTAPQRPRLCLPHHKATRRRDRDQPLHRTGAEPNRGPFALEAPVLEKSETDGKEKKEEGKQLSGDAASVLYAGAARRQQRRYRAVSISVSVDLLCAVVALSLDLGSASALVLRLAASRGDDNGANSLEHPIDNGGATSSEHPVECSAKPRPRPPARRLHPVVSQRPFLDDSSLALLHDLCVPPSSLSRQLQTAMSWSKGGADPGPHTPSHLQENRGISRRDKHLPHTS
ncbi:hypothetical protein C8R45DRAFT_1124556 [Mycena sanguinolenta]|nr:hypothetical protein C8R45DRAFT_1124556 [Mycena sanguinolenta]